jgi:TPP-dependent indolepyruvate ferredoxin oxidoreductase alpha subunit
MSRVLLTGNAAAAWGARLASVDYVPAFPITPQTEIIETLAAWIAKGELDARTLLFESEHSMLTAAGAAAATGVRVFTATSSQGLLYAMEMLYAVAGWRGRSCSSASLAGRSADHARGRSSDSGRPHSGCRPLRHQEVLDLRCSPSAS